MHEPHAADEVDRIVRRLRTLGHRVTEPRRALVEVLAGCDEHLAVDAIATRVHERSPQTHLSTIYRAIESLTACGVVERIHVGQGPPVHHLVGAHHHLVCEECGQVLDIPGDELAALATHLRARYGFELHGDHFALMGRCAEHGVAANGSQVDARIATGPALDAGSTARSDDERR